MKKPEFSSFPRKALVAAVASALVPAASQAAVGRVDFAYGDVRGVSDSGQERRLTRGAEIREGDTVITNRGRAQLRFSDGARTSLLPNSEFRVDKYEYEEEEEEESSGFFSLLKGGLRTITGVIGRLRKEAYQVTTPSATIGIRGTEYLVVLGNSANVWVADGEIEACNDGGCERFEGGESGYIADFDTKPQHTDKKPDTSGGDVDTNEYSASEDVNEDGSFDSLQREEQTTTPVFTDGPLYALAVSVGDNLEAALGSGAPAIVDATFTDGLTLASYSSPGLNGDIGTARVADAGHDQGIIGWGRWVEGTVSVSGGHLSTTCCFPSTPNTLTGTESHHYAVGLPTTDMPTMGTATYSLLGSTPPTVADGSGIGTLDSANLEANFGPSGTVSINMELTIPSGSASGSYQTNANATISGNSFNASGSDTQKGSDGFQTLIEGFFAGAGASHAGLVYHIQAPGQINGAATFTQDGPPVVAEE